ncbi:hypothetical protein C789_5347 [Microcystis aeruginosa FACHB-905 = DIANCHI905]|nr:hypothetical protein C789_5347 [Microcystis aeruginosa FACHB-905 = DIANCHI905]
MGKRTHDVRLVAAMLANEITHLLTFNPSDFAGISSIVKFCKKYMQMTANNC